MPSPLDRPITIELTVKTSQPELLEGLDVWLRLGLISQVQVKRLSTKYLSCPLPELETTTATPQDTVFSNPGFRQESSDLVLQTTQNKSPNFLEGMFQSLVAELSVRWLLFLGVFMVVVSSGVLAASQWQRFPAAGQYTVLLGYTSIFWGVSFWARQQPNLQLTAQTLQIVTLLLVPVNFWAMDSFGLWRNPVDWIVVAIASITLTSITFRLLKNIPPTSSLGRLQNLPFLNILGLSYLHWGWKFAEFPLIAVYAGMVLTTIATVYQIRYRKYPQSGSLRLDEQSPSARAIEENNQPGFGINLPAGLVIYALLVLLFRAIFVVNIPITQLGLAVGICGWLVAWLSQQMPQPAIENRKQEDTQLPITDYQFPLENLGGVLILLGWVVSLRPEFPWQATAVSGLGLWFFISRLQRFEKRQDLAAIFVIGLQTIYLLWLLVPASVQGWAIATGTQLTGSQNSPSALLSLAWFPYLILMVAVSDRLYRINKPDLALFGEQLALSFGALLTLLSLANPTLRSLNLLLSTITLLAVTQRRPIKVSLVYLTHIIGLLTFCSFIDRFFPYLSQEIWASILLAVMVAEWTFSILASHSTFWQRSAWHLGLGLAAISYQLLVPNTYLSWDSDIISRQQWNIIWLVTPLALTGVAKQTTQPQRQLASWLSVTALGMAQVLTFTLPGARLISLGVATGLMLVNTRYLRHQVAAIITIGFGLSFAIMLLWEGVPGVARLSAPGWLIVGAIAFLSLWLSSSWLKRRHGTLAALYAKSADSWAIALCSLEMVSLTVHSLYVYWALVSPSVSVLVAVVLTMGAIAYRSYSQPNNWAFYGLGWCLELLTAEALGFVGRSVINLAIANVALGLMTQLLGEIWRRRSRQEIPSSWHILPLLYGVLGAVLRWDTFTSWTGLSTLAIALIVIGVGRRKQEFKPLVYLGLLGVSISAYQLLLYQLLQASGGGLGDGLIAMSALGTSIMYAYRVLSPWLINYLRLTAPELKVVSHLHWAWSSTLLLSATATPIEINRLLGLGIGLFLIRYAIYQGKRSPLDPPLPTVAGRISTAETWVYLGLLQIAGIRIFWIYTAIGQLWAGPLLPWKAPISCLWAYLLYTLPWERWGWPKRPWQQAAYILPLIMLWESRLEIPPIGLLIVAAFYVLLAKLTKQIRFTYLTAALVDWAIFRWFFDLRLTDALWYITPIGLSLLYIAQIDPNLKLPTQSQTRHNLRLIGTGVICVAAFLLHQETGIQPGILSIIAIFAGLALRVRAFLYVGTATFLLTVFYQLVIFIFDYPFFKWVIGLLVGIAFISIAANFETRRVQLSSLLRNWLAELEQWQ